MPEPTIRWATPEDWPVIWPWVRGAHLLPHWITAENPTTLVAERNGAPVSARVLAFDRSFGAQQQEGYVMFILPLGGYNGEKQG